MAANPFDQFDAPAAPAPAAANPFDQFDAAQPPPQRTWHNTPQENADFDEFEKASGQQMPSVAGAALHGLAAGAGGVGETLGATVKESPEGPETAPLKWSDIAHPWASLAPKLAYTLGKSSPTMAGGIMGATVGAAVPGAGETGVGELAGGAIGAAGGAFLQSYGPTFKAELAATPKDPNGAWDRTWEKAGIDAGGSALSWVAFGAINPFKSTIKNLAFQTFGVQPGISVAQTAAQNVASGEPAGDNLGAAYAQGVAGTLPLAAAHTAIGAAQRVLTNIATGKPAATPPPEAPEAKTEAPAVGQPEAAPVAPASAGEAPAKPQIQEPKVQAQPPNAFDQFDKAVPPQPELPNTSTPAIQVPDVSRETMAAPTPVISDPDAAARKISPWAFQQQDALVDRQNTYRGWLQDLADQRGDNPAVQQVQDRIDTILGKVNGVEDRLTGAAKQRLDQARTDLASVQTQDTPDMAFVRQNLLATQHALWDLSPEVQAARHEAQANLHEATADQTAPEDAAPVADMIRSDIDQSANSISPEIHDGLPYRAGEEDEPVGGENAIPSGRPDEAGAEPVPEEVTQAPGAEPAGRNETAPEGGPAREAPIAGYRRQLADIESRLPAVDPEMTRLWRGNRPGEVGQNPSFTDDPAGIAMPFQKAYGGDLSYVDVPTSDLDEYRSGGPGTGATDAEYMLPENVAKEAKVVQKPVVRRQNPLRPIEGTGDVKTRGLAQGIEANAIEKGLTDGFGNLPEYRQVSMADQAAKAADFINQDYDAAKDVAMGRANAPKGLLPESVLVGVEKRATAEGDVQTLHDLATGSKLISAATTMGQRIRTLGERDPLSPVTHIQDVQDARTADLKARKIDPVQAKAAEVNNMKTEVKRTAASAKKPTWENFINTIVCN